MQIDWFTVAAQVLNFLVLIWLLKRFLYRPVLDAIDAREQRMAKTMEEASLARQQAAGERDLFARRNADLEASKADLLQAGIDEANVQARQLVDNARAEANTLMKQQQDERQRSLQGLRAELQTLAVAEVFAMTRKILGELAGTRLEQSMVEIFIAQLQEMSDSARQPLLLALKKAPAGGLIRSAFGLDASQQTLLAESISTWAGTGVPLQFETDQTLICGLELSAKGQHSAWNIEGRLQELEHAISTHLAATGNHESSAAHG